MQTVICLKWGSRYSSDYVNKLYSSVLRNTSRPLRFICITDDPSGIVDGVEIRPMPEFNLPEIFRFRGFRRMFLFDKSLFDLSGDILHFDLDIIITSSIDPFFDFMPESTFCVPRNWTQAKTDVGNMSVFRYRIGAHYNIWKIFSDNPLEQQRKYKNSQTFVSKNISEISFYPKQWCIGFKQSLIPAWPLNFIIAPKYPKNCIVVAFTGRPDMHEAIEGHWPSPWYKKFYKYIRPAKWILEFWR